MRAALKGMAYATAGLAAVAACATTNEYLALPANDEDGGSTMAWDDAAADTAPVDAPDAAEDASDVSAEPRLCSMDGWCSVPVPDSQLSMVDVWPLAQRTFLLASSPFVGTKVLEWNASSQAWAYVDDETQNEVGDDGRLRQPTTIWAPNDDEVYFAVSSAIDGYVYHGRRPAPPETKWSWTRSQFDGCAYASLWVYGTSSDDVFAGACNRIYQKSGGPNVPAEDAGEPEGDAPEGWTLDHVETNDTAQVSFLGASGTGPEDVWFAGGRVTSRNVECALLVHRTPGGYETIADSDVSDPTRCTAIPGAVSFGGRLHFVAQTGSERIVAFARAVTPVRIVRAVDGGHVAAFGKTITVPSWSSVWTASEDELWMSPNLPTGQVRVGTELWGEAGAYAYSSISLDGQPVLSAIAKIRGTSTTNLWAVGGNHVFHKTTP